MISEERAQEIVAAAAGKRILVVGDLMLDRYVAGRVERISPEAPVPVVQVREERYLPGGAANVALNIQKLGGQAFVAGVMGTDRASEQLLSALKEAGIRTAGVVRDASVTTCQKIRVLADRQQIVRVDREDPPETLAEARGELCSRLAELSGRVDGIVIEDYGKGVIAQGVVDATVRAARASGIPVGLDPKDNHELTFASLTFATPNYREACLAAGVAVSDLDGDPGLHRHLRMAGDALLEKWHASFLIITLGQHGMYLLGEDDAPVVIPTKAREVFDVCGAGDTVIAAAMLGLLAGADHRETATLANHAAGIVVGKIGAATCGPGELMASIREEFHTREESS